MVSLERKRTVAADLSRVWDVLADFDRLAEWADNADHTAWLHDPAADGAMVGRARRVQAKRMVLIETITVWEPPTRLAYELAGLPPVVKSAVNEWRLVADPAGNGSTIVTLTSHVDCGPRPPQQLIARGAGRALARASDVMLAGLDRHLSMTSQPLREEH